MQPPCGAETFSPQVHIRPVFIGESPGKQIFRAPGSTTVEELEGRPTKARLYSDRYAKMRSGVVAHEFHVEAENVTMLSNLDFVFVAVDDSETRHWLLPTLVSRPTIAFM